MHKGLLEKCTALYPCSPLLLWCSGPITPVLPNTETLEEKFLIGTADPTRGSPSASEFHIVQSKGKLGFPEADVDRSLERNDAWQLLEGLTASQTV